MSAKPRQMAKDQYMIGIMSGTSVDGIDVACCRFGKGNRFELLAARTYPYAEDLKALLRNNLHLSSQELFALDARLGDLFGHTVKQFLKAHRLPRPMAIASHGHTVFHNPAQHYTVQIGKGSHIAAVTGLPVVCDFRSTDVALGGQGAPLVPIGDELLFRQYDYCLNLGGFANVSFRRSGKRVAYDLAPCNLPINIIMNALGSEFDWNGATAASGQLIPELLEKLDHLPFYDQKGPKSLGREWVENELMPLMNVYDNKANVLRTYYEHVTGKIGEALNRKGATVLVTGGGAHNIFFMRLLQRRSNAMLVTPDPGLIDFKEAVVFAFLGYRRIHHQVNALRSVTGAKKDSVGGCIYLP